MTASDYGRLVENSKTNFAQTVDRPSPSKSLTQRCADSASSARSKSFVERAVHELDNSTGGDTIRGIYQWVDKSYSTARRSTTASG